MPKAQPQTVGTRNVEEMKLNETHNLSFPEFKGDISEIKGKPEKL